MSGMDIMTKHKNILLILAIGFVLVLIGLTVWAGYMTFLSQQLDGQAVQTEQSTETVPETNHSLKSITVEEKMEILQQLSQNNSTSSSSTPSVEEKRAKLQQLQDNSSGKSDANLTKEEKLKILETLN